MDLPDAKPSQLSGKRPASILELAERAKLDHWNEAHTSLTFKECVRSADRLYKTGKELVKGGNLEDGFVQLALTATLVFETLPSYPEYNILLNATQRQNLTLNGDYILQSLTEIKPQLIVKYDAWLSSQKGSFEDLPLLNHVSPERLLINDDRQQGKDPTEIKTKQKILEGKPVEGLFSNKQSDRIQRSWNTIHPTVGLEYEHESRLSRPDHINKKGQETKALLHLRPVFTPPFIQGNPQKKEESEDSDVTIYSEASSYTDSTDYGLFYRRMALSDESDAPR
ncbi:hypothetical protein CVT25_013595 [Psilocybe cyanescens]|uniref:USP8 dimerisation domain-containing protein n=1 Tax=Psilocybe cyanescens TaxID=93625 RepID=A0A409WSX4_PSICY|nr:hypothetical protein CVT25_013595 [Psilocybe cyanescens]